MTGNTGNLKCNTEDVNNDAYEDLICHFITAELNGLDTSTHDATATCDLIDGTPIQGVDSVYIAKD